MSCDESHTMTVLIFLFLIIFFYIGLKLISLIPPLFQWGFYIHFLIKKFIYTPYIGVYISQQFKYLRCYSLFLGCFWWWNHSRWWIKFCFIHWSMLSDRPCACYLAVCVHVRAVECQCFLTSIGSKISRLTFLDFNTVTKKLLVSARDISHKY